MRSPCVTGAVQGPEFLDGSITSAQKIGLRRSRSAKTCAEKWEGHGRSRKVREKDIHIPTVMYCMDREREREREISSSIYTSVYTYRL